MTRRVLAISNPISGRGLAQKLAPVIAQRAADAGVKVEIAFTDHSGHGRELASGAKAAGFDGVLGIGGDGTLNEIINGLGAHGLPLCVVPLGTANVLAKEIRARRDPGHVARALARWRLLRRDLGRLEGGRLFACFVGAGFDAECTRALHGRKQSIRMSQYLPIMLRAVFKGDFSGIRVRCGEAERVAHYALCAISPCYGGPLELASRANPRDGRFEVMTLHEPVTALTLARMLVLGFMRATRASHAARFAAGASVMIEGPKEGRAVPFQVDGDYAGELPVQCESLPGALTLIDPS